MEILKSIWVPRALIVIGFVLGWNSMSATVGHLGNDLFLLTPNAPLTPTHS